MKMRAVLLKMAVVVIFLVMFGCATTKAPSRPEKLTTKITPEYKMNGKAGGIDVVHLAVIVYEDKKAQALDWANQNMLKIGGGVEELRMEFEVNVKDPKISQIFVQLFLNGVSSGWQPIIPLKKSNVFWVKLPTESGEQVEALVRLRLDRVGSKSKLIRIKELKYKLVD